VYQIVWLGFPHSFRGFASGRKENIEMHAASSVVENTQHWLLEQGFWIAECTVVHQIRFACLSSFAMQDWSESNLSTLKIWTEQV
jgi:hypothetical protein